MAERADDPFVRAVRRRMDEIGMSERKARFVTAIEFGLLPDGDIVTEGPETSEVPPRQQTNQTP
ncbi:MAG TPA: hypothetical protein VH482_36710 [Thermomicrobiales bacterium]